MVWSQAARSCHPIERSKCRLVSEIESGIINFTFTAVAVRQTYRGKRVIQFTLGNTYP